MRTRKFILCLTLVSMLGVVLIGCNTTQEKQPTEQTKKDTQPVTTAQYVGSDTCNGCHTAVHDEAIKSKHFSAFKPLSDYPLAEPAGQITLYDSKNPQTSGTVDLTSTDQVYGVMMDHYVIAKAPQGFGQEVYRVAALEKEGDKYTLKTAKNTDVNNDGKPDYTAESFTCGGCHAPGIEVGAKEFGVSCESCHGPGGDHVSATDKKGTMQSQVATQACKSCHESNPSKDAEGKWTADNHYGTRNYFASKHSQSDMLNDCQTCHTPHKVNANGSLLRADNPNDVCAKCHSGNINVDELMWKNPTDAHGHFTRDHSFGAIPYQDLGDKQGTPAIEITNQKVIDLITKLIPEAAK